VKRTLKPVAFAARSGKAGDESGFNRVVADLKKRSEIVEVASFAARARAGDRRRRLRQLFGQPSRLPWLATDHIAPRPSGIQLQTFLAYEIASVLQPLKEGFLQRGAGLRKVEIANHRHRLSAPGAASGQAPALAIKPMNSRRLITVSRFSFAGQKVSAEYITQKKKAGPTIRRAGPMSGLGQTEKNSVRAYVFRLALQTRTLLNAGRHVSNVPRSDIRLTMTSP